MPIEYRVLEMKTSDEWLPIGVAVADEGHVNLHLTGRAHPRAIAVPRVSELTAAHLWGADLRWSAVEHCSREHGGDPRHLLGEIAARGGPLRGTHDFDEVIRRGATMEEVAQLREPVATTPSEAIRELKRGNSRFYSMHSTAHNVSPVERRAQSLQQTPFAVVLGCSDSRVPVEFIFDQGPGNLFIVRVAGNVVGPNTLASVEYAVRHLKSHLVLVLGHEGCGAVAAAMLPKSVRDTESENVRTLLERIAPAVDGLPSIRDRQARMREAVVANVREQVHMLRKNAVVREYEGSGKIAVVGGFYSISSGAVDMFETEEELAVDPARRAADAARA